MVIKTAKNTKIDSKIIKANNKGGMSISPKDTMNKSVEKFINIKLKYLKIILSQLDKTFYKVDNIKTPKAKR